MILAVRTGAEPSDLIEAVRSEVRALDKDLPLAEVKTLETVAATAVAGQRFTLWLVGFFAADRARCWRPSESTACFRIWWRSGRTRSACEWRWERNWATS